ncbi:MarR family transcriptional regulator [Methanobrevibacter thaueri]|uniref:ArnR1-like winged helix-turn-helix domain-containing protein n=1 Tax=Methanobrevibacter thaueri TaxID=190975 RepID=A0A315XPG1_9EURY|nr:MarR family transcriptional regulator [Methanobrevibacter thaueri]PWB87863.1 hypothetical protein MBBTH_04500 [Methanobrevibacter thaueri]
MNTDKHDFIRALSYVKRSSNRRDVVNIINKSLLMPSEIAKIMDLRVNQISAILSDLKKENIVVCINEHEKVGRLYELTPLGLEIYYYLKEMEQE